MTRGILLNILNPMISILVEGFSPGNVVDDEGGSGVAVIDPIN